MQSLSRNWRSWPVEQKLELHRRLKRKLESRGDPQKAEAHLREFTRQAWACVEARPYVPNWHIDAICDHLEACTYGQIRNLLINIPPRCSKSLLACVFWFCWTWIRSPETRWLFASYSQTLSTRDSVKCRNILTSNWYQTFWGDRFTLASDQNQKTRFENTATGFRVATSVGGMGTGEGGDYLVCDDPHNAREGESDAKRQEVLDWWTGTISTRGNDAKTACKVIIMQRLHEKDLSGHVLEEGGYEHLCLPMEYDPKRHCATSIGFNDPRKEEGELLCEERFPPQEVATIKRSLGPYGAAGQLQQSPVAKTGAIFAQTSFRYFLERDLPDASQRPSGLAPAKIFELASTDGAVKRFLSWDCWWFQTVDTAMKIKQHNDYTVVGTFVVTPEYDLLVYEIARVKLEVPKQFDFLVQQRLKYPWLEFVAVEDAASGTGLIQQGASQGLPFRTITPTQDKVANSSSVATMYQNGKVYHRQIQDGGQPAWLVDYESELMKFPRGAHDDQVDVTSNAGRIVTERSLKSYAVITRPILGSERRRPQQPESGVTTQNEGEDKIDPVTELLRNLIAKEQADE